MGLGIFIKGEIKKPLLSFLKKRSDFENIQEYIIDNSSGLFKEFLSFSENENKLLVTLHPCEEAVEFELLGKEIICSAKTNSVGPGYHAYLVELIEKLGKEIGIEWFWDLEEGEDYYQDETGYYEHRNFEQLQIEMLRWMRALANSFSTTDSEQYMISFPLNYPRMQPDYFAVSPLRKWTKEWFDHVASTELEDLHMEGKKFFIWWNKDRDALFYKNTGIALLNVECPWHFPVDENETRIFSLIDQCFSQAQKKAPDLLLPQEDWEAVKQFLANSEATIPDSEFGYKKGLMTFDLAGKWLIDLPGYFFYSIDDGSEVFWDHMRTVRNIVYTLDKKDKSDTEFAETFFKEEEHPVSEKLSSETNIPGEAIIYYFIDQASNEEYWILQGIKVIGDKFILSTICYPTDEHKEWAIQTWNSVRQG